MPVPGDIVVHVGVAHRQVRVDFKRLEVFSFATVLGRPVLARAEDQRDGRAFGPCVEQQGRRDTEPDERCRPRRGYWWTARWTGSHRLSAGDERCGSVLIVEVQGRRAGRGGVEDQDGRDARLGSGKVGAGGMRGDRRRGRRRADRESRLDGLKATRRLWLRLHKGVPHGGKASKSW